MLKRPLGISIKCRAFALATLLALAIPSLLQAQDGVINLGALPNYAKQFIPNYISEDTTPMGPQPGIVNPITDRGATLGRLLFYDKRLSRNNTVSCSSCHQQAHAFTTPDIVGTGVAGTTGRHPMPVINMRFNRGPQVFWDGRVFGLENAVTQPVRNAIEMGFSGTNGDPTFNDLLAKLSALPEYQILFNAAFGSPGIDELRIQKALSQFLRSIQSLDSKFDAGALAAGNPLVPFPTFTQSENRGKQLFINPLGAPGGGLGCTTCHFESTFSSPFGGGAGNNGVIAAIGGGTDLNITNSPALRDMFNPSGQLNGPLMHNGSFTSIAQVIDHYSAVPDNPNLSVLLRHQVLNLTAEDRLALEDFFRTLTGKAVYTDPKWSNPFRADGSITIIDSTPPASQTVNLSTRLRVLTGNNVGIGGFIVTGTAPKRVLIRGLGPSLAQFGLSNLLADPTITLNGPAGFAPIVNDNWQSSQQDEIIATQLAPGDDREPAIIATLNPGAYTAILSGTDGGTGTGILEIYDLDFAADSRLANISTRAFVGSGDDMVIAGFTVGNAAGVDNLIVRGLGPSLQAFSVGQVLSDPKLEVRNADGATLALNDNWLESSQANDTIATGLAPVNFSESAVEITLGPGAYTALLSAAPRQFSTNTGVGIIEVYSRGALP